jgi:hypothetical protein
MGINRGLAAAIVGVVLCDFIGVMLFSVPGIGWLLAAAAMVVGSFLVPWLTLETHPKRSALTWTIGAANALVLVLAALVMVAILIASFSLPDFSDVRFG